MRIKIELYIVSLTFLFVLIAVNQIPVCYGEDCNFIGFEKLFITWPPVLLFCIVGITLAIRFIWKFNYRYGKGGAGPTEIISTIESLQFENLGFLATYVIPLLCFDLDFHLNADRNFIMLLLVLGLVGWIYIKANLFYTNPTLAALNFKIYRISTPGLKNVIIITKATLEVGDAILPREIDAKIYFATLFKHDQEASSSN